MTPNSQKNAVATSWFGRLIRNFVLLGEAVELSDAERLERRISALEAGAAEQRDGAAQTPATMS